MVSTVFSPDRPVARVVRLFRLALLGSQASRVVRAYSYLYYLLLVAMHGPQDAAESLPLDRLSVKGKAGRSLELATWNSCGPTHERLQYVMDELNEDVVGLTELHGLPKEPCEVEESFRGRIVGGEPCQPRDPAAGVATTLSKRASHLLIASRRDGSRIVWVRLAGLFTNMLFMCAYIPHAYRSHAPYQRDVLQSLEKPADAISVKRAISTANCRGTPLQ